MEESSDIKTIVRRLKEYEEKARTGGEHMLIGEIPIGKKYGRMTKSNSA